MSAALRANHLCGFSITLTQRGRREVVRLTTLLPERIHENDRLAGQHFRRVEQFILLGAGFDLRMIKLRPGSEMGGWSWTCPPPSKSSTTQ